ncbi:T3SS effector HopA1 family protein [Streptomyces brasiliscabiei]|uniref:T3SS effector HopA1 family protein n=1 Tax=Streptomyces brasiliscabiei TaxID=2736302 RepID=UPI001C0FAB17|nr:T3SS effector HopA1 family protein [Streptomyces brasiliscabiei]
MTESFPFFDSQGAGFDVGAGFDSNLATVIENVTVANDGSCVKVGGRYVTAETTRDLCQKTANAIYEVFHVGRRIAASGLSEHSFQRSLHDPVLVRRLESSILHTVSPVVISRIDRSCVDARIVVIDGLRILLEPADEIEDGQVWFPAVRRGLSPGFLLVDGSRGRPASGPLLRVYLQVGDPDDGVRLWGEVIRRLESARVRYRAKVTSAERLYPRRDGLVVYIGEDAWGIIPALIQELQSKEKVCQPNLSSEFARVISPGVALAWEPKDTRPGRRGVSFGQHRAAAIADALFAATPAGGGRPLRECLEREFREANIDFTAIHRNINSPKLPYC